MDEGMELLQTAIEQDKNDKLYMWWINGGYEKSMPFFDFKTRVSTPADTRSAADIISHVRGLLGGAADGNI